MSRNKVPIEHDDLKKILTAVFTLCLLNENLDDSQLLQLVSAAQADARKKTLSLVPNKAKSIDLVLLGSILHRWSRTPQYLDDDARPFPIRATGRAPSVEALFRAENRKLNFTKGLQDMRTIKLVRRNRAGLYLPKNDSILLHTRTPEMVANLALSVHRLVTTLLHNTAASRRSEERLIERNALVKDLPREKLKGFIRFSREQGAALVTTMNDWLENNRAAGKRLTKRSMRRTVSAGIHVFAFSDKDCSD